MLSRCSRSTWPNTAQTHQIDCIQAAYHEQIQPLPFDCCNCNLPHATTTARHQTSRAHYAPGYNCIHYGTQPHTCMVSSFASSNRLATAGLMATARDRPGTDTGAGAWAATLAWAAATVARVAELASAARLCMGHNHTWDCVASTVPSAGHTADCRCRE